MRRALLLATLLVVPALASAQAPGAVTFANGRTFPMYVNATECSSTNGSTVTARWTPLFGGGQTSAPSDGTYTIYGSNIAPVNNLCYTQSSTSGTVVTAGPVADQDGNTAGLSAVISTFTLINAAGKSCSNDGESVYICVQGNSPTLGIFAFASAVVTISTAIPPPPVVTGLKPGDRALNVYWDVGAATTVFTGDTQNIEFEAIPVDTTGAPAGASLNAGRFTASPARFEGLTNDVVYEVHGKAYSKADNASDWSTAITTGMPQPVMDFWEYYKFRGGRDDGGCSSGLSGPLGLGILLATLVLARRRR